MEFGLAMAAALLFGLGSVLQGRAAATATDAEAASAGFLLRLARKPLWLVGIGADLGGLICHAAALSKGRLVVVQPVLACTLVFALALGAWFDHRRLRWRELLGSIAVAGGLAVFLLVANPAGGRKDPALIDWVVGGSVCALVCVPLVAEGRASTPRYKAALLGCAAGVLFGLSAALIKSTVGRLDGGIIHVVADWHLYALAAVGWISMTLGESSLQVGRLAPALATQTTLDPVTSLLLGVLAFGEAIHTSALGVVVAVAGIGVVVGGIVVLAGAQASLSDPVPTADSQPSAVVQIR